MGNWIKAPWKQYEKTEFTKDGLFHVARNHSRVNRYNKALSVDGWSLAQYRRKFPYIRIDSWNSNTWGTGSKRRGNSTKRPSSRRTGCSMWHGTIAASIATTKRYRSTVGLWHNTDVSFLILGSIVGIPIHGELDQSAVETVRKDRVHEGRAVPCGTEP